MMGSIPAFTDNKDQIVALLEQIVHNTGDLDNLDQDITLEGARIDERTGLIPHRSVRVIESGHLDPDTHDMTPDGAVILDPGDEATLAEYRDSHAVYAVGATDASGVAYSLEVDGEIAIGPTRGPLGTVNSPFSFVEKYGGALPANDRTILKAHYPEGESGQIELVGRLHIENVPEQI